MDSLETLFQALGDRTRLRLLNLLAEGEICVCYFVEVLREPQPKISRHLAYLRNAGLVEARRDGKWMAYRLTPPTDPPARAIFEKVLDEISREKSMRKDRESLARSCCSPRVPEILRRAPRPELGP